MSDLVLFVLRNLGNRPTVRLGATESRAHHEGSRGRTTSTGHGA